MKLYILFVLSLGVAKNSAILNFADKSGAPFTALKECSKDRKCALFCIAKKLNYMNNDGTVDSAKIPFYDGLKDVGLTKTCIDDIKETDNCKKVNSMKMCFIREGRKLLKENWSACFKEAKLSEERMNVMTLIKLFNGNKFKCFNRCMMLKFKVLGEDNKPRIDVFAKTMTEKGYDVDDIKDVINDCADKNKQEDKCIQASQIGRCVAMESLKKFGLRQLMQFSSLVM